MPQLKFEGQQIPLEAGNTVLDTLLDSGHAVPNNCRAGACQSCLIQITEGEVPANAQLGLKDTLAAQGYALACQCRPETDIVVRLPAPNALRIAASVSGLTLLCDDVMQLRLRSETPLDYHAGQYLTLWKDEQLGRSYSLASVPGLDDELCFHIKRIPDGQFSGWVFDELQIGDALQLQGPAGDCFYLQDDPDRELILAGTGTGLAPLYGIARDALMQGHTGPIHLFHGALQTDGLYLHQALLDLDASQSNFHYHASALNGEADAAAHIQTEPVEQLIQAAAPNPKNCTAYLCGAADFVNQLRKRLFLAGASMNDIYADAFLASSGDGQAEA